MTSSAEVRWRQREVDRLLQRLRRIVREQLELRRETVAPAALDAKRMEAERVRWKVAAAVKRNAPALWEKQGLFASSQSPTDSRSS